IVKGLLEFSRAKEFERKPTALADVVARSVGLVSSQVPAGVEILREVPGDIIIPMDAQRMQEVFINLLINALQAISGQSGRITISALRDVERGQAVISVSDTGAGIGQEDLARIFDPFFTTKEVGKGTGLGLSSVYGIVKQSGGSITVESAPGKGSSFRVFLPAAALEEKAVSSPPVSPYAAIQHLESILVVEDEETVRRFVQRTLEARGYSVRIANNGAEALAMGRRDGSIDLLLTDIVMPGLNGSLVAERLKALHPRMRVLYMSGYPDSVLRPDGLQERAICFLQKPFGQDGLLHAVRAALDQSRRIPVGRPLP
ncbi:MAG TPA: ATP-binding protein, partial [Fibrobacteria bacterium]|nr:ATP-binding protein [Fibrobacteria bacterium]